MHQTKIPRYNSKTLIIMHSEMSSECQLFHTTSSEQIFISLHLKNAIYQRWLVLFWKQASVSHGASATHTAQCQLLLQFAWRKCLISLVTHLMTLSHLVSTGRTVFLSYWKVTKIWGIFVCEVTNVYPICFFQLRWFNFCNFVLSLHFPLYCLFYLTSFKPTEICPNMQWP